jgi:menaquinone-dependent protoporphyrinogen oxidase
MTRRSLLHGILNNLAIRASERPEASGPFSTRRHPGAGHTMVVEVTKMHVLVVYATKYGATKGIAERIGRKLAECDHHATVVSASDSVDALDGYDAYVIGSAVFIGSWLKEGSAFVRRNHAVLAKRPVWLFSSGPIGTRSVDDQGRDVRDAAVPKEITEFKPLIQARDHHVFYGAFDPAKLSFTHRMVCSMPALKKLLVEGDFRDWNEIDGWAESIATSLSPVGVS